MGLFTRRDPQTRSVTAPSAGVETIAPTRGLLSSSLWGDRLGRWSVRSLQLLLIIALSALTIWALVQVKLVVIPLLIAIILAAAASPVIVRLRRWMPPMLAAWITLLGGLAVFGGIVTLIVFAVRNQWDELVASATEGFEDLQRWLADLQLPIDQAQITAARDAIVDFITSAEFGAGAIAGVSLATEFVTGTVLVIVVLFFFLKDGDRIWAFLLRPFDGARLERGRRIGDTSVKVLGGYIRGTAIVGLVDALVIGVGLAILQVPLALPLAVIVFLGSFIPLVGATVAGVFAALVALVANGPVVALIVVLIVIVVNQLEGDLLQPIVMSQSLKLHPLIILVALTVGTILGGIAGAVLAVPIAAVGWAIVKVWDKPDPTLDARKQLRLRRGARKAS
ncbi:AI-2E family transporter [Ruicaihuangia caeni]|uniref:AI-2E family transporter n=1 Tax=Ruicaihuangia caeni TaxID=3042517 RepID=UPI00338F5975